MNINISTILIAILVIFLLYIVIGLVWAGIEKLIYGKTKPSKIDDVVAVILAISIYFNFN